MTPTDQDDLIRDLTAQLGVAAGRADVPVDGRTKVTARVRGRQTRRRVQAGLAAVVSVVVLVAGIAVISDRSGNQSLPVVSGPETGDAFGTWHGAPLLAPDGIEWSVLHWDPNVTAESADGAAVSTIRFEHGTVTWLLAVSLGEETVPEPSGAGVEVSTSTTSLDVGGRSIAVNEQTVTFGEEDGSGRSKTSSSTAKWTASGGFTVVLTGIEDVLNSEAGGSDAPSADGVRVLTRAPSEELLADVLSRIQPVALETWSAAVRPPAGVPDPVSGEPDRPVRLGLPVADAATVLQVSPWVTTWSEIRPTSSARPFHLGVSTVDGSVPVGMISSSEGMPVTVRGVEGQLIRRDPQRDDVVIGRGTEAPGVAAGVIQWTEGASTVTLMFPEGVSDDEVIALANALVVLDDAQWNALLFPGPSPTSPPELTDAAVSELTLDESSPEYLPPLAPVSGDWRIISYATGNEYVPAGYQEDFISGGVSWRLMVDPTQAEPQPGVEVEIGDRTVRLLGGSVPSDPVGAAQWTDPSGATVMLMVVEVLEPIDYTVEVMPGFDGLTGEEVSSMVEQIQPVPANEWFAALDPPDHLLDPFYANTVDEPRLNGFDATRRPIHLGLAESSATQLSVQPWTIAQSYLEVDGFAPGTFRLGVQSTDLMRFMSEPTSGTPVRVRGMDGRYLTEGEVTSGESMADAARFSFTGRVLPGFTRSISWEEDGSTITLEFQDGPSPERALAVADSLVVLDDAQWAELLGF